MQFDVFFRTYGLNKMHAMLMNCEQSALFCNQSRGRVGLYNYVGTGENAISGERTAVRNPE